MGIGGQCSRERAGAVGMGVNVVGRGVSAVGRWDGRYSREGSQCNRVGVNAVERRPMQWGEGSVQ